MLGGGRKEVGEARWAEFLKTLAEGICLARVAKESKAQQLLSIDLLQQGPLLPRWYQTSVHEGKANAAPVPTRAGSAIVETEQRDSTTQSGWSMASVVNPGQRPIRLYMDPMVQKRNSKAVRSF